MDAQVERAAALLTLGYGQAIPAETFDKLRKAAVYFNRGEYALANIVLAYLRLPEINDDALAKTCLAERQLDASLIEVRRNPQTFQL